MAAEGLAQPGGLLLRALSPGTCPASSSISPTQCVPGLCRACKAVKTTNPSSHDSPAATPAPSPLLSPLRAGASSCAKLNLLQAGPTNSNSAAPGSLFHLCINKTSGGAGWWVQPLAPARSLPRRGLRCSGWTKTLVSFSHGCKERRAEPAALPTQGWIHRPWLSHASTQQIRLEWHNFKKPPIFWRRTYVWLITCKFFCSSQPSPAPCSLSSSLPAISTSLSLPSLHEVHTVLVSAMCHAPSPQQPCPTPPGLMSPSLGTACGHRLFAAKP